MKKLFQRMFQKRIMEADLTMESSKAATHYMRLQGKLPLDEEHRILNYVAHGFYMGVRWLENEQGAKERRDDPGRRYQ